MPAIDHVIRGAGYFLRRRDLLALGFTDGQLRSALARRRIFRVRQGWYSVPDAPASGVRAVRVGGRLTSLSALESFGLPVPRQSALHVAVAPSASRLRHPDNRHVRLRRADVDVHWLGGRGSSTWRVTPVEALSVVISTESREVAVAAASAAIRRRLVTASDLDRLFSSAPARAHRWRQLVSRLDESHGETFTRLWLGDAGIACEQQARVDGVGRIDFRLAPHLYLEVDGAQHDSAWMGQEPSSWHHDHERDLALALRGDRVLRITYRQLYSDWPQVLAAIERAISDARALDARRSRHPYRPRAQRKRRSSTAKAPP